MLLLFAMSGSIAPLDCLQYFTARTGSVRSFNWRDVGGMRTRQLANQDYSICFKTMPGFTVVFHLKSNPNAQLIVQSLLWPHCRKLYA